MFPVISANIGINIVVSLSYCSAAPAIEHGQAVEIVKSMMRLFVALFMRADQQREHRSQQHEDKRLNQPHQHFQKVKRDRDNDAAKPAGHEPGHRFEHVLARENITVKSEAEGNRPEKN